MSKSNKKKTSMGLILAVLAAAVLIAALLLIPGKEQLPQETEAAAVTETVAETTEAAEAVILKNALQIEKIDSYTGLYVEDGSDEAVSGLLMMIVTNISEDPIQYAEITLTLGEETARFTVSVLPAGGSAVLIEQNRMVFDETADYTQAQAECVHLAGFDKALSLQQDKLDVQVLNGAINITNISGSDITGDIILCYKNVSNGVYHGGIAYRVRLEGGMKAGEIKQIMGTHFHQSDSEILFVDIAA